MSLFHGKPLPGTPLNLLHPQARGLIAYYPILEGAGGATYDAVRGRQALVSAGAGWSGSKSGRAIQVPGVGSLDIGNIGGATASNLPQWQQTSFRSLNSLKSISYWVRSNIAAPASSKFDYLGGFDLNRFRQGVSDLAVPNGFTGTTSIWIDGKLQADYYGADIVPNGNMEVDSGWSGLGAVTQLQSTNANVDFAGANSRVVVTSNEFTGIQATVSPATSTLYKIEGFCFPADISPYFDFNDNGTGGDIVTVGFVYPTQSNWIHSFGYGTSRASNSSPIVAALGWNNGHGVPANGAFYTDRFMLRPVTTRFPISDTGWHHVVITTSEAVSAGAVTFGKRDTGCHPDIGNPQTAYANAQFDDIRFYDRELTQAEVTDIRDRPYAAFRASRSQVWMGSAAAGGDVTITLTTASLNFTPQALAPQATITATTAVLNETPQPLSPQASMALSSAALGMTPQDVAAQSTITATAADLKFTPQPLTITGSQVITLTTASLSMTAQPLNVVDGSAAQTTVVIGTPTRTGAVPRRERKTVFGKRRRYLKWDATLQRYVSRQISVGEDDEKTVIVPEEPREEELSAPALLAVKPKPERTPVAPVAPAPTVTLKPLTKKTTKPLPRRAARIVLKVPKGIEIAEGSEPFTQEEIEEIAMLLALMDDDD